MFGLVESLWQRTQWPLDSEVGAGFSRELRGTSQAVSSSHGELQGEEEAFSLFALGH